MNKNSDFWKKNFTWMHLVAMAVGLLLAMLYWYKSGQFSDNILKNNPVLMALWGLATGYILIDLVKSSKDRDEKKE
jgi:cobalamin synthase